MSKLQAAMPARVLHIIDHLGLGGAQAIVKGLLEHQPTSSHIFLTALRQRDVTVAIAHPNVEYARTTARYSLAPLPHLRQRILQERITVAHCHLFRACILGLMLKIRYFPNLGLIFHEQGQIMGSDTRFDLRVWWYRRMLRFSRPYVDTYIAVSEAIRQRLILTSGIRAEQVALIPNFIDVERFVRPASFRRAARHDLQQRGIGTDEFVVGWAGRIIPRKGWREYLEAADYVVRSGARVKFLLSGDGPDANRLRTMIHRRNLQESVVFLGYTADMLRFYASLDCYVMTSYWEGLPLTQLEVMAAGVTLITTDGPGLNEIPRKGTDALFVATGNAHDLAERILTLFRDPALCKRLRDNARERVRQYHVSNALRPLKDIYQICLRKTMT